jgi:hypothetical protein
LIYLRARYYEPTVGRFISRDSWGGDYSRPNTLNLWNYGYSNPIRYTDPSGKDPIGECFGFFMFAFAEPTFIGEGAAIGCLIILSIAATTLLIAQHSEEFVESCEVAWDVLVEPLVRPKPGVTYPSDSIVRGVDPFSLPKMWPTPEHNLKPRVAPEPIMPPIPSPPKATETPRPKHEFYFSEIGKYIGRDINLIIRDLEYISYITGVPGLINQLKKEVIPPFLMGRKFESDRALYYFGLGRLLDVNATSGMYDLHVEGMGTIEYIEVKWSAGAVNRGTLIKTIAKARMHPSRTYLIETTYILLEDQKYLIKEGGIKYR